MKNRQKHKLNNRQKLQLRKLFKVQRTGVGCYVFKGEIPVNIPITITSKRKKIRCHYTAEPPTDAEREAYKKLMVGGTPDATLKVELKNVLIDLKTNFPDLYRDDEK